jgi:hypothetical protein
LEEKILGINLVSLELNNLDNYNRNCQEENYCLESNGICLAQGNCECGENFFGSDCSLNLN